ncbi:MAG: hypothetical protein OEQ53_20985, partial [Saprospiraceae bacterium]|nr:hypothetical protein [Saprospiraceae bacterium]
MKKFLVSFLVMIPYWFMAIVFYFIFRFYGLEQTPGITVDAPDVALATANFGFVIVGIVAAFIYTLVETIADSPPLKRKPLGLTLLVKSLSTFAIIFLISYLVNTLLP